MNRSFVQERRIPRAYLVGWWLAAALAGGTAQASDDRLLACRFAEPPVIPSGAEADADEMAATERRVRKFVGAMQDSLDCLNALAEAEGTSDTERARLVALHDNGVDQMRAIADAFNRELKAFRWRDDQEVSPDQVRDADDLVHH